MIRSAFALSLLSVVVLVAPARAQEDERNDPAFKKYEKKVIKLADDIQDEVAKMRGLKFQAPVPKGVATEAELKKSLVDEFEKPDNIKQAETEGKVAKAFGLIPKDFEYRKEMRDLLADQIAGFYDNDAKRLRLVKKKLMEGLPEQAQEMNDQMVMAHELEHALQDQNFDLKRWEAIVDGHNDRSQAFRCVVEGEATIVGFRFMFQKMGAPCPDMKSLWKMQNSLGGADPNREKMDKLPPYLTRNLLAAYEDGSIFVEAVYDKGSWEAVSKLFQEPPTSTSQILHPKRYFEHWEPREISMPGLAKLMKGNEIDQSTMGEMNVRLILEEHGQKKKGARTIASGWAGDRYQLFTSADSKQVLAWLTTWEDETKAEAFETAYRAGLEKTSEGFTLERRGTEVLLVAAADKDLRAKVAAKAWLSAFDVGHLKPFAPMLEKPPTTDFTNPDTSSGFGVTAPAAALGASIKDDDLGISMRLPAGFEKADETIQPIKDFSRGLWKDKNAELRVVDLPMPFDKDSLLQQFEAFVRKGTKEFKKGKDRALTIGGHDAFELEFEGIVPDGTEEKREAKAVVIERDSMTLVVILTAKKDGLKAALPGFDAAIATLRFAPARLANEQTIKVSGLSFSTSPSFGKDSAEGVDRYASKDGQATITVVTTKAPISDIDTDLKETESVRAKNLKGYRSLGTSTFSHDALGMVYTSDYEADGKDGKKRVHELVALAGDLRIQLTCACPPDAYDKYRPAFERAIWTLKTDGGAVRKPEKKPPAKPQGDDEPF